MPLKTLTINGYSFILYLYGDNLTTKYRYDERLVFDMKKMISFLLCLMILFAAVPPAMAADPVIISKVVFTLTLPKPGTKADGHPIVTVPAGSPYHVVTSECHWMVKEWQYTSDIYLPSDTVFEPGKDYCAEISIRPNDGGEFTPETEVVCTNAKIVDPFTESNWIDPYVQFTVPSEIVSLSKLKSVKLKALSAKKIEVKWKKLSKKEQGKIQKIQIQYSTDKSFKTGVKTKWAKKTKDSYTIKGLKKNTKYYIRIRVYKKEGNIVYVSQWVTKNKKTKKK